MFATEALQLARWESFYVIVGSSAGALTGLQFVVIALRQETLNESARHAIRAFGSPTIVHFTTVLALAAILSIPEHTHASLGATVLIIATGLLLYVLWAFRKARQQDVYTPDLGDWIWHYCLPSLVYVGMMVAGASAWHSPDTTMTVVSAGVLGLLIIGIHNAWDAAVWIVINRSGPQDG
ncbi:MAG: hypothetical protein WAT66_04995 [Actinomycetota bacterium]